MGVLKKYYLHRGDMIEWHMKMYDMYDTCRALFGHPIKLDDLGKNNRDIPCKLGNVTSTIQALTNRHRSDAVVDFSLTSHFFPSSLLT